MSVTVQPQERRAAIERARRASRLAGNVLRFRELGLLVALAVVVAVTTIDNPRFLSAQSIRDLLLNASIVALLTVGQTLVVITRNVDLSVGSVLGLTAFVTGNLFVDHPGLPIVAALLVGVLIGVACGAVNGAITAVGRVPSLVVTLGTLYVYRGIDYAFAGGRQVNAENLPDGLLNLGSGRVLGVPYLAIVTVVVVAAAAWALRSYRWGRELYAIGSNPDAAVLAGVPVGRRVLAELQASGARTLLIESDEDAVRDLREARERGEVEVVVGNAAAAPVLAEANLAGARALIVAVSDPFEGGQIVRAARALRPDLPIVARAHTPECVGHLGGLGASEVVYGEQELARSMFEAAQPRRDPGH